MQRSSRGTIDVLTVKTALTRVILLISFDKPMIVSRIFQCIGKTVMSQKVRVSQPLFPITLGNRGKICSEQG